MIELRQDRTAEVGVARPRTGHRHLPQKRVHRFAVRHAILGEFVAKIFEREIEPLREPHGVFHGDRSIRKKARHSRGGFQMPLVIRCEQASRGIEVRVMSRAGEHIEHGPLLARRVEHSIRREQRQLRCLGEVGERVVFPLLRAVKMTLHLDENIFPSKGGREHLHAAHGGGAVIARQRAAHRAFFIAGERDQSRGKLREFIPAHRCFGFCAAQFRARDELAKIAVARPAGGQHGHHAPVVHRQFRADDGADAVLLCSGKKSRRAINAVAVADGHRGQAELRRLRRQVLRQRRAAQKTARTARMEFDVFHG